MGLSRAALEEAINHVKGWVQFGQPLAAFQVTQFKIDEMATRLRAVRKTHWTATSARRAAASTTSNGAGPDPTPICFMPTGSARAPTGPSSGT